MSAALHAHAQIALMPWRRRGQHPAVSALLVALAFAPALLVALLESVALGGMVAIGTLCALLQGLWLVQFGSLLRQNHPTFARLVPQHLQRLREHAVGTLLALAALSGLLAGAVFGHGLGVVLLAAVSMTIGALLLRWPQLWIAVSVMPAMAAWFGRSPTWQGLKTGFAGLYQQQPVLVVMLAALLLPALNCLHLRPGGERHQKGYARGERARQVMRNAMLGQSMARHQGFLGYRIARMFTVPYRARMTRLLADALPAIVLARAELAFGAGSHWTMQLFGALMFTVVLVVTALIATVGYGVDLAMLRQHAGFGLTIGAMSLAINPVLALRTTMHASRREQVLLMLLPGMPRGAALNRALALRLARQFGVAWAAGLLFVVALTGGTAVFRPALTFAIACLPAGLLLWRDWAHMAAPTVNGQVWPVLLLMFGAGLLAGLVHWVGLPVWCVALGVTALTAGVGARRWRRLSHFPQALPVGRLA